jgi:nucleotide-binding universal stress UspA family protein
VAFDSFGGVFVMQDVIEALDDQAATLQSRVRERLGKEDVSWEYIKSNGSIPQAIIAYAALADVVVMGRTPSGEKPDRSALGRLGDLVLKSRSPILIPGADGADFNPLGKAMIAWNGSYEAANAVRGALSLLKLAARVELVRVEEKEDTLFPSTRLLEYLSRHDIHADLRMETIEKDFVAETLIARALHTDASHIILGGYGHTRIGEYIFGGVTRSMLASSPVNLVIAH